MTIWRPGMKAVCIKVGPWDGEELDRACGVANSYPRQGDNLTVRSVTADEEGIFLRFAEITNPQCHYFEGLGEVEFDARHFRPLTEKKTDISCFTAILDRVNSKKRHPKKVEA